MKKIVAGLVLLSLLCTSFCIVNTTSSDISVSCRTYCVGNIFFDDSYKTIEIVYSNRASAQYNLEIEYRIYNQVNMDSALITTQKCLTVAPCAAVKDYLNVLETELGYGVYQLVVDVKDSNEMMIATSTLSFSLCVSVPEGSSNTRLGILPHLSRGEGRNINATLDILKKTGFSSIRGEYLWHRCEKETEDGTRFERIQSAANAFRLADEKGFSNLFIADYSNAAVLKTIPEEVAEAEKNGETITNYYLPKTQKGRDAFVQYVLKVLEENAEYIDVIEVWNEPNIESFSNNVFYGTEDGPLYYSYLLRDVYTAVTKEYPHILIAGPVVHSVMSDAGMKWMEEFLSIDGIENYFDILTFHNYSVKERGFAAILEKIKEGLALIKNYVPDKKIYITEFGTDGYEDWTGEGESDPQLKASRVARYYLLLDSNDFAEKYYVYQFSETNEQQNFALTEAHNGETPYVARPALLALANVNRMVANAENRNCELVGENLYKLSFTDEKREQTVYALFTVDETETIYYFNEECQSIEFYDMYGNEITVPKEERGYAISVSGNPIYVKISRQEGIQITASQNEKMVTVTGKIPDAHEGERIAVRIFDRDTPVWFSQSVIDENLTFRFSFQPLRLADVYVVQLGSKSIQTINDSMYVIQFNRREITDVGTVNLLLQSASGHVISFEEYCNATSLSVQAEFFDEEENREFTVILAFKKGDILQSVEIIKSSEMTASQGKYTYVLDQKEQNADTVNLFMFQDLYELKPKTDKVVLH